MKTNCRQAAELECISLDRPLRLGERIALKLHHLLCRCPVCCAHKDQLQCFENTISEYKGAMECCEREHKNKLCNEAKNRICDKLKQELKADTE